ncbi:MAG: DNA polymerase III subunit delta' [Hyphomonadaceae bacterium]
MSQIAPEELGPVVGQVHARGEWLAAVASGRIHHAWLLRGPRGVGKSRMALQIAAHLLSGAGADSSLAETSEGPVGRMIAAGSHPDFRIIRRPVDDKGKMKSEIPVDSVRSLESFFSLRPALGGWRVAIVDAVDELNRNGANAILKTLEEPPARSVLLLVSHGEQAVLPTIRSRCRMLKFDPLSRSESIDALKSAGVPEDRARHVVDLAPGRPGAGLALEGADASAARAAIERLLPSLGAADARSFHSALMAASKSDAAFAAAFETLRAGLEDRARRERDPVLAGALAEAALEVVRCATEAAALNQDRAQALAEALGRLRERTAHLAAAGSA